MTSKSIEKGCGCKPDSRNHRRNKDNSFKNNNLSSNFIWIEVPIAATLLGVSPQAIRKNIQNGKYNVRTEKHPGGYRYLIALDSLPVDAQVKYWEMRASSNITTSSPATVAGSGTVPGPAALLLDPSEWDPVEVELLANEPAWRRQKVEQALVLLRATQGLKGQALKDWLTAWNRNHPDQAVSYQTLMRWRQVMQEQGVLGLLPGWGKRAGSSKIPDAWFNRFIKLYLQEGAPSLRSCWLAVYGWARTLQPGLRVQDFPSMNAFLYRLKRDFTEEVIYQKRYGPAKWNRKYGNYIDRQYDDVAAGEVWVADHAQIDVGILVEAPARGRGQKPKVAFPWVTAFRDLRTGLWVGWIVHVEPPNSDHIFQAAQHGFSRHGLPRALILDNGKDFRVKDFAGGRRYWKLQLEQDQVRSMLALLRIDVVFAQPYNAQAKPIERDFLKNKEWFSKHAPGYRGGNVTERPERLKTEIKSGNILPLKDFLTLFDEYVETVLNRMPSRGKVLKGLSPQQAWQRYQKPGVLRQISEDALKLYCMRITGDVTVGRNGVRDPESGMHYWHEVLAGWKGKKVYLRRDPRHWEEAYVFSAADDSFICKARLGVFTAPAFAKTELQRQQLKEAMRARNRSHRLVREAIEVERIPIEETIRNMASGLEGLQNDLPTTPEPPTPEPLRLLTPMDAVARQVARGTEQGARDEIISQLAGSLPGQKGQRLYLFESDKISISSEKQRGKK